MSNSQFLSKYGNESVQFIELYKNRVNFINKELGIHVSGSIEYRSSINDTEYIYDIAQLDNFEFMFIKYS